jgi:hypothetical protein
MFGITSAGLSKDIENAIATFTKTVVKLEEVVNKAHQEKQAKEVEIANLKIECDALDDAANKATNLASKIKNLIS